MRCRHHRNFRAHCHELRLPHHKHSPPITRPSRLLVPRTGRRQDRQTTAVVADNHRQRPSSVVIIHRCRRRCIVVVVSHHRRRCRCVAVSVTHSSWFAVGDQKHSLYNVQSVREISKLIIVIDRVSQPGCMHAGASLIGIEACLWSEIWML